MVESSRRTRYQRNNELCNVHSPQLAEHTVRGSTLLRTAKELQKWHAQFDLHMHSPRHGAAAATLCIRMHAPRHSAPSSAHMCAVCGDSATVRAATQLQHSNPR